MALVMQDFLIYNNVICEILVPQGDSVLVMRWLHEVPNRIFSLPDSHYMISTEPTRFADIPPPKIMDRSILSGETIM